MMRLRFTAALLWMLMACGDTRKPPPKFYLEGSLTQLFNLGFDEARIIRAPEDISLLFVRRRPIDNIDTADAGSAEDYPLKVSYRTLGDDVSAGGTVDLAQTDDVGVQRSTLSRSVAQDLRTSFPPLVRGALTFEAPLIENTLVKGNFHVTFTNGTDAASGRTAFGQFTAWVQP